MSTNARRNFSMSGGSTNSTIIGLILLIVIFIGLYYIYQWLYKTKGGVKVTSILSGSPSMTATAIDKVSGQGAVAAVDLSGVSDAGQYSTSFWVYVADTKGFLGPGGSTHLAHLMEISNNRFSSSAQGNTLIYVGLNPVNAALVVRQSTMDPNEQINNSLSSPRANSYPLESLIDNYNIGANPSNSEVPFKSKDRCDIINGIEYQRWVLITVVGNSRTLDVYIDGKLARSCVYSSGFSLGPKGNGTAYFGLNNNGNLKGYFSTGNFYNYALTPDAVWKIYQDGPGGPFSLWNWLTNTFSVNVNTNQVAMNQLNPCTACQQTGS